MKPPKILDIDVALVDKAISLWSAGQCVAFPTETVYGLGADSTNGKAVAGIYALKSRPHINPLIVHVASADIAKQYVEWNALAEALAKAFWPGPLTLILKRKSLCPISELVSAGGNTLAIRVPSHPVALQLLRAWGGGIAAPSANRSGRVSPTTVQHVREEFGDAIALMIDGGACDVGLESTVVDCTGDAPMILRPGAITGEMMVRVPSLRGGSLADDAIHLPSSVVKMDCFGLRRPRNDGVLLSPGQLESHYAPSIPVRINATDVGANEALLAFGPKTLTGAARQLNLSPTGDLIEAAANLFAYLRALDDPSYSAIAVMPIPDEGIGAAINDRLTRAAAER